MKKKVVGGVVGREWAEDEFRVGRFYNTSMIVLTYSAALPQEIILSRRGFFQGAWTLAGQLTCGVTAGA